MNKARYGYRRILAVLRQKGYIINHKTVLKLMKSLNLQAKQKKSKYKSYKGEVKIIMTTQDTIVVTVPSTKAIITPTKKRSCRQSLKKKLYSRETV